ncbi:MAG: hypothetical protein KDC94_11295 [Aequorivita sp.]|nr:hypothetical protein [Aequorivita sp.]
MRASRGGRKDATGVISLDTYYIYDVYGNLTFVLPPKLSEQILTNGNIPSTLMDELGYQYRYGHRNRAIMKKIPECNRWGKD